MTSYYIFGDISTIAGQILMVQKIKVKFNPSLSWALPSSVPACYSSSFEVHKRESMEHNVTLLVWYLSWFRVEKSYDVFQEHVSLFLV